MAASRSESEIPTLLSRPTAFIRPPAMTIGSRSSAATTTIGADCAPRWKMKTWRAILATRRLRDDSMHRDAIDASIAAWSRKLDRAAIESRLQSHGVPAHQVQNSADAYADPQFVHRGHFVALDHPSLGKFTVEAPRAKLSRTPAAVRRAAPSLGQDNQHVLESILGYDETQISELVASGALG